MPRNRVLVTLFLVVVGGLNACAGDPSVRPGKEPVRNLAPDGECLLQPVYFDYDEYTLNPQGGALLDRLAECIVRTARPVVLEGHTDSRGTEEYNFALSQRMAAQVRRYLQRAGVPDALMQTESRGESQPPCLEPTEGCRARCRRVEIRFAN